MTGACGREPLSPSQTETLPKFAPFPSLGAPGYGCHQRPGVSPLRIPGALARSSRAFRASDSVITASRR